MVDINALQQAIVGNLSPSVSATVWDEVAPGTDYPYIVVGEFTEVPAELHDQGGKDVTLTIHVWSDGLGSKETNKLLQEIEAVLHHGQGSLVINGARCWSMVREFSQILLDEDPDTGRTLRHGVVRYRAGLEEV